MHSSPFEWRELPGLVVRVIQDAGKPVNVGEITIAILHARSIVPATSSERKAIAGRIARAISDKHRRGVLRAAGKVGSLILWEMNPDLYDERAEAARKRAEAKPARLCSGRR